MDLSRNLTQPDQFMVGYGQSVNANGPCPFFHALPAHRMNRVNFERTTESTPLTNTRVICDQGMNPAR